MLVSGSKDSTLKVIAFDSVVYLGVRAFPLLFFHAGFASRSCVAWLRDSFAESSVVTG